jgi:RNA polymerase sigma factor (sigma-70 family)
MEARDRIADLLPRLRRYARALSGSGAQADDLVRVTLERAGQQLRITHSASDLRAWLFGLMHEAYVRSVAQGEAEPEAELQPESLPPQPSGEAMPLSTFERAIGALAPGQREGFLLVTLEDMSYEEVAKALNIPVGTVMSRLSRARERLRLALMSQARLRMVK